MRVGEVIAREFGVRYHKNHIPRLLRAVGWTPQLPLEQAAQRDEARIAEWRRDVWPELKKRLGVSAAPLSWLMKRRFTCCPGIGRTWAPGGQRPVLHCVASHDHLSMVSGITPHGQLYTLTRDYPLTSWESLLFLCPLRRRIGTNLLAIWDGSPIQRSAEVKSFLAQGGAQFVWLERLPPYARISTPMSESGSSSSTSSCAICVAMICFISLQRSTSQSIACAETRLSFSPSLRERDWYSERFSYLGVKD